jgi:hypothetical protein
MPHTHWIPGETGWDDAWLQREDSFAYFKHCDNNRLIRMLEPLVTKYTIHLYTLYVANSFSVNELRHHALDAAILDFERKRTAIELHRDTLQYWHRLSIAALKLLEIDPENGDIRALGTVTIVRSIHCALQDLTLRLDMYVEVFVSYSWLIVFRLYDPNGNHWVDQYHKSEFCKALKNLDNILNTEIIDDDTGFNTTREQFEEAFNSGIVWKVTQEEKEWPTVLDILTTWDKLEKTIRRQLPYVWFKKPF